MEARPELLQIQMTVQPAAGRVVEGGSKKGGKAWLWEAAVGRDGGREPAGAGARFPRGEGLW